MKVLAIVFLLITSPARADDRTDALDKYREALEATLPKQQTETQDRLRDIARELDDIEDLMILREFSK